MLFISKKILISLRLRPETQMQGYSNHIRFADGQSFAMQLCVMVSTRFVISTFVFILAFKVSFYLNFQIQRKRLSFY